MRGRFVLSCGGDCIKGIGCEVCAAVEHTDEGEWLGEHNAMRSEKEGGEGCL